MAAPSIQHSDRPWRRPGSLRYALSRLRGIASPPITVTESPAEIIAERDAEVVTRDGTILRANVFRPPGNAACPVVLCAHPYGKDDLPRRRGKRWTYSIQYRMLRQPDPITFSALTGWEGPDPVWWTAQGFAVVNADLTCRVSKCQCWSAAASLTNLCTAAGRSARSLEQVRHGRGCTPTAAVSGQPFTQRRPAPSNSRSSALCLTAKTRCRRAACGWRCAKTARRWPPFAKRLSGP